MSSLCRSLVLLLVLGASTAATAQSPLRVCSDPDDLPFSNTSRAGFDNRIAELIARDLHRRVQFVWARARRGFIRERFNSGVCDVLMGVPAGMKRVRTTIPYYRSSYVFVTRKRDQLQLTRFDDPRIGTQRIGLQILEDDYAPPSVPLARSGHAAQFVGYTSFGAAGEEIVRAVADKRVGFSVVWGPLAGYYVARQRVPLSMTPVSPAVDTSGIPFSYAISMAVHSSDTALAEALNGAIRRNQAQILRILNVYHVPVEGLKGSAS